MKRVHFSEALAMTESELLNTLDAQLKELGNDSSVPLKTQTDIMFVRNLVWALQDQARKREYNGKCEQSVKEVMQDFHEYADSLGIGALL